MKAQRAQLCEISCFYQYAHHVIIDVASLLDEAALPEASSPYVVASLDEAASHNEAALIAEGVLLHLLRLTHMKKPRLERQALLMRQPHLL